MSEVIATPRSNWDDLMLAMDVVDTLRHREAALDDILNEEADNKALIEKVKRIYAAQGIDVSERLIVDAVSALKEERFTYRPPKPGFRRWLAHLYIDRAKWFKRTGIAAGLVGAIGGGSYAIDNYRESRALAHQQQLVSNARGAFSDALNRINSQRQSAEAALEQLSNNAPGPITRNAVGAMRADGEARLAELQVHQATLQAVNPNADLTFDKIDAGKAFRLPAGVQQPLAAAQAAAEAATAALGGARQLVVAEQQYQALAQRGRAVASGTNARKAITDLTENARGSLASGDLAAARGAVASLQQMVDTVAASYQIRIVSRPNVRSGVWRVPDSNRNARNYYIVVEAIDSGGRVLSLPITSEETEQTETVKMWGLRVSDNIFEQVKRDKLDDGIIQNNIFGRKQAGRLDPEYRFNVIGGAITRW